MTVKQFLIASLVALGLTALPIAMSAQEQALLTAENVTDAQIEGFVKAAIALESLRSEYTTKIGNAESEDAQNELRAEADRVAMQLVDKVRGITAQEYLEISKLAPQNAELTERINAQVEVMRAQKAAFEKKQAEAAKAIEAQRASEAQAEMKAQSGEATTE